MLVLAVDTSTPTVTTGVGEVTPDRAVVLRAERRVDTPRGHAEILTTLILECLTEAGVARSDLDAVVVGAGPGPFTGLRVGMATAAAFADALAIPLQGVCSLDAIRSDAGAGRVLVVTDARRREVYWALYGPDGRMAGPAVDTPADLIGRLRGETVDLIVGSTSHTALFGEPTDDSISAPTTTGLVAAARDALESGAAPEPVVPLYLRRPDAVELKDRKR
ncbi:tRNA (adenosine(37)-N6)-threonylcarbamoyltransferase complex dimerization subunit type 1 TsaB [Williamsia maris]|uniref:tRNA threonylcarbamoyl adenosine modification protein YeaZ n=1 Tax=Williamsia maris TaxID=72806 RepID=A0ABT1H811_9NOCA|nr:tRNA (adenosine(37)-N6)-threonylcarbamoyltransferase complex dimerization subunit type 1 TsaB [Williamsia maris]MCP2174400.1 tRNA threonylcarbamoyl adenosine modification protein YeaZ [Williamsia maris]